MASNSCSLSFKGKSLSVQSFADLSVRRQGNYLKASIEKNIMILAHSFEIKNLETFKKHQQKLNSLKKNIPLKAQDLPYYQFIWKLIQPEELEKLNNLRTGVNHKKGISDLQAHSYLDKDLASSPLGKKFDILMEQHRKNTAVLIAVLALLTDDLMYRKMPSEIDLAFMADLAQKYSKE